MAVPLVLLPGAGLPVGLAYRALLAELGDEVMPLPKDLDLFAEERPPPDASVELEVESLRAMVDAAGLERFHLLGFSAGGAVGLAFAAEHPQRLRSLALIEPAWAGNEGLGPQETAVWQEFGRIMVLPAEQRMARFRSLHLRPEIPVPPPEPGPPAPWMARRPDGLPVLVQAFQRHRLDRAGLSSFRGPAYLALGWLSNPDYLGQESDRLARILPDCEVEVYAQRHHFDTPQQAEPGRLAAALRRLWARA